MPPRSSRFRTPIAALVALCTVGAALATGGAAEARPAFSGRPAPLPVSAATHHGWRTKGRSVDVPASRVVDQAAPRAGERSRLRVVKVVTHDGAPRVTVETVAGRTAAVAAVRRAQESDAVLSVSLDTRVHLLDGTTSSPVAAAAGDPFRTSQWALTRLGAETVWQQARGKGAVVAVIDTGVDATHSDLAGQVASGTDFLSGGDGRTDANGHGTHVAGIIAAVQGNAIGVAGLAPAARILPVRVLDATGSGWTSDTARGITWAADQGADVISMSLGGPDLDPAVQTAVTYALGKGSIVVAAAGNARLTDNAVNYPGALPGVVAVASTDQDDASSSFSNTGSYVDVAAPGGDILSTYPGNRYAVMSGTSMATPYVAASAALAVQASGGSLTGAQFEAALDATDYDLGADGRDNEFGFGLVDPGKLVACVVTHCTATTDPGSTQPAPGTPLTQPSTTQPAPVTQPIQPAPITQPSQPDPITQPAPTEPAPTPAPKILPAPAKTAVALRFVRGGGRATRGEHRTIVIRALERGTRHPVTGLRVHIVARHAGRVVAARWVVTDEHGRATARFAIRSTSRFTMSSPATTETRAARCATSVRWQAVVRRGHARR